MRKLLVSIFLLSTTLLVANDIQKQQSQVDRLVQDIKVAKPSQRRVLMNQLKVELRGMNQESRRKTMMGLKKSFAKGEHSGQCENFQRGQGQGKYRGENGAQNRPQNSPKHNRQGKGR